MKRQNNAWGLSVALAILLIAPAVPSCVHAAGLAITNCSLFDSVSGTMLADRTVIVEGSRITAIGTPSSPVPIPSGARVVDGQGRYVIPGLIDAHCHLIFLLEDVGLNGEDLLPLYLGNGVTTVRSAGDPVAREKLLADFAAANPESCPTVFMCSPLIDGYPPYHPGDVSVSITDPDDVPAFVDQMVSYGVTTLKLYVGVSPEVFARVVQEGHSRGLVVSAHLGSISTQQAVDYGIDVIEHIWGATANPDTMAQMVAQGTMNAPTLAVFRNMIYLCDLPEVYQNPDNYYVPKGLHDSWDAYRLATGFSESNRQSRIDTMDYYYWLTGLELTSGVTLLAGTDSAEPYCPPGSALQQELELLVRSGLSPGAALQCATINNAKALGQMANLGSVEVGKVADLIVLTANPLEDIRNTRAIQWVVHNGILCDPKTILPELRVPDPPETNLLTNPGFESGVPFAVFTDATKAGWSGHVLNGGYFCEESFLWWALPVVGARSGEEAAASALARDHSPGTAALYQNVPVTPGTMYFASTWLNAADYSGDHSGFGSNPGDQAGLYIAETDEHGGDITAHVEYVSQPTEGYVRKVVGLKTGAATVGVRFVLFTNIHSDEYKTRAVFDDCDFRQARPVRLGVAKKQAGEEVCLLGLPVTAAFDGCFYVEEPDRSAGIKAIGSVSPDATVDLVGTISTIDGEKTLVADYVGDHQGAAVADPRPLGMTVRSACTALSAGLLVTVWGRVRTMGVGTFTIDDGSGQALTVQCPEGYLATAGQYIKVTGVLGATMQDGRSVPILRALSIGAIN